MFDTLAVNCEANEADFSRNYHQRTGQSLREIILIFTNVKFKTVLSEGS